MNDAIRITPSDNVAVVTRFITSEMQVSYSEKTSTTSFVRAICDIPIYHKIALCDIAIGDIIIKYGECIGEATCNIMAGDHVHCHNVASISNDIFTELQKED